jgi:hypothetical protein
VGSKDIFFFSLLTIAFAIMTDYANLRKIVTGDIIVKCNLRRVSAVMFKLIMLLKIGRFGNDIRRIPINQVPTYDE